MRKRCGERCEPGGLCPGGNHCSASLSGRFGFELGVLTQNRLLEAAQTLAWLEPELVVQLLAQRAVDAESFRLPAAAVEREHQLLLEALAQRVAPGEHRQLRQERATVAGLEARVVPQLVHDEPQLVQAGAERREARFVEPVERVAVPQAERLGQHGGTFGRATSRDLRPSRVHQLLELRQIERSGGCAEEIRVLARLDHITAECLAKLGDVHLQRLRG